MLRKRLGIGTVLLRSFFFLNRAHQKNHALRQTFRHGKSGIYRNLFILILEAFDLVRFQIGRTGQILLRIGCVFLFFLFALGIHSLIKGILKAFSGSFRKSFFSRKRKVFSTSAFSYESFGASAVFSLRIQNKILLRILHCEHRNLLLSHCYDALHHNH